MHRKAIHIVSSLGSINFGIWNAAIFAFDFLQTTHSISSYVWVPGTPGSTPLYPVDLQIQWLGRSPLDDVTINEALAANDLNPSNTVVVSHGSWLLPTRLARRLVKKGFHWIYVPHGMLEPWSMSQNKLKKTIFFNLLEKRLVSHSTRIRAVSKKERDNLSARFQRPVDLVENGVYLPPLSRKSTTHRTFLFLSRLHHKKGIVQLAKGWHLAMKERSDCRLIIAGPDQGEFHKIKPYLSANAEYVGAVYGREKEALLNEAHYFLLPSFSEGFPVSVLEAMSFGLIPLISEGCNFNEVFEEKLGLRLEADVEQISKTLNDIVMSSYDESLSSKNRFFIQANFSEKTIGNKLFNLYSSLLTS
jgi:glycosyltransferase involved in cell wall biosynthesis